MPKVSLEHRIQAQVAQKLLQSPDLEQAKQTTKTSTEGWVLTQTERGQVDIEIQKALGQYSKPNEQEVVKREAQQKLESIAQSNGVTPRRLLKNIHSGVVKALPPRPLGQGDLVSNMMALSGVSENLLGRLDDLSLQRLSTLSQSTRSGVKRQVDMERDSGITPERMRTKPGFALEGMDSFPKLFVNDTTRKKVELKTGMEESWRQYGSTQKSTDKGPAYIERKDDKDQIFGRKGYGNPTRFGMEKNKRLFKPEQRGVWSPQGNDGWMLGQIHKNRDVHIMAPLTMDNLWDAKFNRPTAMGRELVQLLLAGYTIDPQTPVSTKEDPFNGGILLRAPKDGRGQIRSFEDAVSPQALGLLTSAAETYTNNPKLQLPPKRTY